MGSFLLLLWEDLQLQAGQGLIPKFLQPQEPLRFPRILRGDISAACTGEQVYMLGQVTFRSPFFVPAPEQTVIFSTAAKMKIPCYVFGFPSRSPQVHGV